MLAKLHTPPFTTNTRLTAGFLLNTAHNKSRGVNPVFFIGFRILARPHGFTKISGYLRVLRVFGKFLAVICSFFGGFLGFPVNILFLCGPGQTESHARAIRIFYNKNNY